MKKTRCKFILFLCNLFVFTGIFILISGCPPTQKFELNPQVLSFGEKAVVKSVAIKPKGKFKLEWSVVEVMWDSNLSKWYENDVPWLSAEPTSDKTSTVQLVQVRVTRSGLASGEYKDVGLKFRSSKMEHVVPVSMVVSNVLEVTPQIVNIRPGMTQTTITLKNIGSESFNWTVEYIPDLSNKTATDKVPMDISVSPVSGNLASGSSSQVTVSWDKARSADFGLLFRSPQGDQIVEFRFVPICSESDFEVSPKELVLIVTTEALTSETVVSLPPSKLTFTNRSSAKKDWTAQIIDASGQPINSIVVSPSAGAINASDKVDISAVVTAPKEVILGAGQYTLLIDTSDCILTVPIKIEQMSLPKIAISEPPQTTTTRPEIIPLDVLDFGREDTQKEFWIANIGPRDSKLYFRITHEDEGKENPIIVDIQPAIGGANGEDGNAEDFFHPELVNVLIDGVRILVTINRDNLQNDVEYRNITIEALDRDPIQFSDEATVLSAVESKTIKIRVERQPLRIEGALNRSRPPYVMRYVFLLRDSSSRAIPTVTNDDLSKLSLTISEDGVPLDLYETSYFVTGPQDIKGNMVILLDYTGSTYYAGVNDKINPLRPGEAIERVKKAVVDFIYDLPDSYQIALMLHNDRQQTNRLIRSFTTNKDVLKDALESFYVPPNLMGASDIYDALSEAIDRLMAEDSKNPLPFDDADVKSIVFITDGWDNASTVDASNIQNKAHDNLIRLYPLGFASGGSINNADLIQLATETGGHLYVANDVNKLVQLLGNQKSLVLRPDLQSSGNDLSFFIYNEGDGNLGWQADLSKLPKWISEITPSQGTIPSKGNVKVTVKTQPGLADADVVVTSEIPITSNDGDGVIKVSGVSKTVGWESVSIGLDDGAGRIWEELKNQMVLTYITPKQKDFKYTIRFEYKPGENLPVLTGIFEEDAFAYIGDVRAGQLSLVTSGLFYGNDPTNPTRRTWQAEVFVRADYIPRDVYFLRTRYFLQKPEGVTDAQWNLLLANVQMNVEPAEGGLLSYENSGWRFIKEGDGIYLILTSEDNAFTYGAFGNLFKITLSGLDTYVQSFGDAEPILNLAMRVDNESLVSPATPRQSSRTKYFLYPGGPTYLDGLLSITTSAKVAGPSTSIEGLTGLPFNPEDIGVWDADKDGLPDFQDPVPNDKNIPGTWVKPTVLNIPANANSISFTVINNRLDTFSWEIQSSPAWVTELKYGEQANSNTPKSTLAPGEKEIVTLYVDRTGYAPGTQVQDVLVIKSDLFGTLNINIGMNT